MNDVKLYTKENQLVATVRIPIMDDPPSVILWSEPLVVGVQRCFVRTQRQIYVECTVFSVPPAGTKEVAP